jgi:hypothetical protein
VTGVGGKPGGAARFDPLAFVERHGVVLASARGPVPSVAEAVAGEPIRGSWWAHAKGHEIFGALSAIDDSPDVLCFKLVAGKVTFVHRRMWAALVCLAGEIGEDRLAAIKQEHTDSGAHRNIVTPFPDWVPREISAAARTLDPAAARAQLGMWMEAPAPGVTGKRSGAPGSRRPRRRA